MQKVIRYDDEQTQDFANIEKKTVSVGADFPYNHNKLWNITSAILYHGIMRPFAFLYCKIKFRVKFYGREKLRSTDGSYMLYGNHTLMAGDAFIPNLATYPRRTYVIVHPDNISTPLTKNFVLMSGGVPIPTDRHGYKNFMAAVEQHLKKGHAMVVYPEAHIWPYFTGIRSFPSVSFQYPIRFGVPAYCSTTTFQKKRFGRTPKVSVYIDGPFMPDESLPVKEREHALRNTVFETMTARAEQGNTYAPIQYIRNEVAK